MKRVFGQVMLELGFLTSASATGLPGFAPGTAAERAVACAIDAYNSHDVRAQTKCYTANAVIVRDGKNSPFDWAAERGYREFDSVVDSRFRHEIVWTEETEIEVALFEDNEFLLALGIEDLPSRWRYVIREGLIAEVHHLNEPLPAFVSSLRAFTRWIQAERPAQSATILDSEGFLVFNGETAATMLALAREWERQGRVSAVFQLYWVQQAQCGSSPSFPLSTRSALFPK